MFCLPASASQRCGFAGRRGDDFDELPLDDRRRGFGVERAVEGNDPAEGGGRVRLVGPQVGVEQARRDSDAAGIRVLDDHAGRFLELAHAFDRRVRVGDVVVGELLALQLTR